MTEFILEYIQYRCLTTVETAYSYILPVFVDSIGFFSFVKFLGFGIFFFLAYLLSTSLFTSTHSFLNRHVLFLPPPPSSSPTFSLPLSFSLLSKLG
jgi:hypothetical protein